MYIDLPSMSGIDVMQQLQKSKVTRNIPVIALSANATARDIENVFKAGFNDYVTKPIDIDILLQSIESFLTIAKAGKSN